MGIAVSIVSAVLKSVVGDKFGNGLVKNIVGISIDGISEKGINEITDFINKGKYKIDNIFSEEKNDYVVTEIKNLFSKISITNELLKQCRYDSLNLSAFLWNKYYECKNDYIECEGEIKRCLFTIAEAVIKLLRESEEFEKDVLIQISNSVDDTNVELQKVYDYIKDNFDKLDDNSQIILNILSTILKQLQKINIRDNATISIMNETKTSQNNKKEKYIENWNSRLFLHVDNNENPITLADAFIVPNFNYYIKGSNIKFSNKDSLLNIINKFIKYNKTSNMLITGSPGIGKTSIISWIANKYKDYNDLIVLRFRDWSNKDLEQGILNAIYNSLNWERSDLENKILVLDGFDEIKVANERKIMIHDFLYNALDFDNLKIIVTSRHNYLDEYDFQNAFELLPFNILQIQDFYQIIKGIELDREKIDCDNLDVLGIPVILYMAIMVNIDLTIKSTRPELYNRIFAEKGGIFDRLSFVKNGYDNGFQPLRDRDNIRLYLNFLQKVAFSMFEKKDLYLTSDEYNIPELKYQGEKLEVIEFPIKPFFEMDGFKIEFIHNSIYEYFVSEYICDSLEQAINKSDVEIASVIGYILKQNILSSEILEYLKYKIKDKLVDKNNVVHTSFQMMLREGMTYYHTKEHYKDIIECEMNIFYNMLEFIHLWEDESLDIVDSRDLVNYIRYGRQHKMNLANIELKNSDFKDVDLRKADLRNSDLENINLSGANLSNADLSGANMDGAVLIGANLSNTKLENAYLIRANLERAVLINASLNFADITLANLNGANLFEANLSGADLRGMDLRRTNLRGANLSGANLSRANLSRVDFQKAIIDDIILDYANITDAIFDIDQIKILEKRYSLKHVRIYAWTETGIVYYGRF